MAKCKNENQIRISFGAQYGDMASADAVDKHRDRLRAILNAMNGSSSSEQATEFAFILRVDGEIHNWGRAGTSHLRYTKKDKCVQIDVFMPEEVWRSGDDFSIRKYLHDQFNDGFALMIQRLKKANVELDYADIVPQFQAAINVFLSEIPERHALRPM